MFKKSTLLLIFLIYVILTVSCSSGRSFTPVQITPPDIISPQQPEAASQNAEESRQAIRFREFLYRHLIKSGHQVSENYYNLGVIFDKQDNLPIGSIEIRKKRTDVKETEPENVGQLSCWLNDKYWKYLYSHNCPFQ